MRMGFVTLAHKANQIGLTLDISEIKPYRKMFGCSDIFFQEDDPYIINAITENELRKLLLKYEDIYMDISWFREHQKYNFILLKNCFRTQDLPPTPTNDGAPEQSLWRDQAAMLMAAISVTGHKVASYKDEMKGRLAHMVMPSNDCKKSWERSSKLLHPHTEVVHGSWTEHLPPNTKIQTIAPEVFGLACLRNPTQTATTLWCLNDILSNLSHSTVEELKKPNYEATSQSSFDTELKVGKLSILCEIENKLVIRYSHSKLKRETQKARFALDELREFLKQPSCINRVTLQPGDILIVNNRTTLHGRDSLMETAKYNGEDRWLVRMYGFSFDAWKKLQCHNRKLHVVLSHMDSQS